MLPPMACGESWEELKYREVFEEELSALEHRRQSDPTCSVSDIEAVLETLYLMDGNNQDGRGNPRQIGLDATIAAYEQFLCEWRRQLSTASPLSMEKK